MRICRTSNARPTEVNITQKGEVQMPVKNKSSITTKLIGFAIVAAVVVFGAKSQMPITDLQTAEQIQRAQLPMAAVPVDRNSLSQQLLPSLSSFNSVDSIQKTSYIESTETEVYAGSDQKVSQPGPSIFELRLDDQKAWGSQPRRASLVSATRQPVGSSEKVGVASSQSPIVPGHDDPHLCYESQYLELAIGDACTQKEQLILIDTAEFTELPSLSPPITFSSILPPKSVPNVATPKESVPVKAFPKKAFPVKPAPAPAARMARSWETGRY